MNPNQSSAKKSKKNKKQNSLCESVTSEEKRDISNLEVKDQSSIIERTSHEFTLLIDDQHPRFDKLKSRHAALLHPSVIRAFGSPWYFYIKGKDKCGLCVSFNDKTLKKSTIVLKESIGFSHEEIVELYPYPKLVTKAANVTVFFDAKIDSSKKVKDQVLDILRNQRFFCLGTKFNFPYLDGCEFSITSILPAETENCTDFSQSNVTNDLTCGQSESSYAELTSKLSEFSLNDDSLSSNYECDPKKLSEAEIPAFFTLYSRTSVTIENPDDEMTGQSKVVTTFDDIIGLDKELHSIKVFINNSLAVSNSYEAAAVVFITGPRGSGKSMILEAISKEFNANIETLVWYDIYSKRLSEGIAELKKTFERARKRAPSIVLIDDFQYLIPSDGSEKVTSSILSQEIKNCVGKQVTIVAASYEPNSEKEVLNLKDIDVKNIQLRLPDIHERENIILKLLEGEKYSLSTDEIKKFASKSHGFTGKDLEETLKDAAKYYLRSKGPKDSLPFSAVENILPSRKLTINKSEVKIKKVKWDDIGGMCQLKEKLKSIIEGPLKYPEAYKRFGVKSPKGVLLYGPPGCSKTMIAKAIATECDFHFVSKNVSDIHNKYVGESEKAVHDLFLSARAKTPCIVFLDEIDALIPSRGSSTGSGVEERVVNTFLQEIDGIEELNNVILVAATNRPDRIDEAFLRYGRINHYIYVPLPDLKARKEIFCIHKKKRKVDPSVDFDELALKTEGYSGAEIVNVWNEAAFEVLRENSECRIFKRHHFEKALQIIPPRTDKKLLEIYETFNTKFCTGQ